MAGGVYFHFDDIFLVIISDFHDSLIYGICNCGISGKMYDVKKEKFFFSAVFKKLISFYSVAVNPSVCCFTCFF